MNKEIDLQKIEDPLKDYIQNQYNIPLEEYSNLLTKYQLLRLDNNFLPFHITHGCLSEKNINKLIDLLIKKNKTLKSLNLSNCFVNINVIEKLKFLKNLKSLNLHNTFDYIKIFRENRRFNLDNLFRIENKIITEISNLNLKLLDISNNTYLYKPALLTKMKSLEILSMEKCKFENNSQNMRYGMFSNLKELDISDNDISNIEIQEISILPKLKLLYCDNINIIGASTAAHNNFNYLVNNIIKIKTLEYLDISIKNIHIDTNEFTDDEHIIVDINDFEEGINQWTIQDDNVLDKINLLISKLPKLKKLKCVFNTRYNYNNSKEITMNGVKVILNEEVYALKLAEEYN